MYEKIAFGNFVIYERFQYDENARAIEIRYEDYSDHLSLIDVVIFNNTYKISPVSKNQIYFKVPQFTEKIFEDIEKYVHPQFAKIILNSLTYRQFTCPICNRIFEFLVPKTKKIKTIDSIFIEKLGICRRCAGTHEECAICHTWISKNKAIYSEDYEAYVCQNCLKEVF